MKQKIIDSSNKSSSFETYAIGEFARLIGKSVSTLQRWDKKQILVADRTHTNRRFYTMMHYHLFFTLQKVRCKKIIAYIRARSPNNRALMRAQKQLIKDYAKASQLSIDCWINDIGLGINYTREGFLQLMDAVARHLVDTVIFVSKDRLAIHGYKWFERYCHQNGTKLISLDRVDIIKEELQAELKYVRDFHLNWEQLL